MTATAIEFDAYHHWLGIPPKDQPPNHYRLLAIDLFEANTDVVANAADRQMAHVRTFQTGRRRCIRNRAQRVTGAVAELAQWAIDRCGGL